ncbi:MAG: sugar ABC transporter permease [Trueperaceae bacterium]|nr:sugar ABC transporter permease [Trueperaceae bacterium]
MRYHRQDTVAAYLFLLPFLLLLTIFFGYATIRAVYFSFTDYDLFTTPNWVGLRNYVDLFRDPLFLSALRNSVLFAIVVTTIQTFLALVMASVLNQKVRGIGFFRAAFFMPSVTSSVVITLIFLWMFQRRGLFNYLTHQIQSAAPLILTFLAIVVVVQVAHVAWERSRRLPAGLFDPALLVVSLLAAGVGTWLLAVTGVVGARDLPPVDFIWLQTRATIPPGAPFWLSVPIPLAAIMIQNIFTTVPTFMLMFLAGLQDVPKSHYEAASLDGASPVQQFFQITIPSVRPVTFLVLTLSMIGTLQMFDQVAIFGDAAPLRSMVTLAYFVYNRMFPGAQTPEVGFAAAGAIFLALLTLTVVLIQRRLVRSEAS